MDQYKSSAKICSHAYWYVHWRYLGTTFHGSCLYDGKSLCVCVSCCRRGNCKKASVGLQCEVGLRCRAYYVLCGSVLSVWNELEEVLTPVSGTNVKVQIVRLRTEDGQRIVGELNASAASQLICPVAFLSAVEQIACSHLILLTCAVTYWFICRLMVDSELFVPQD